MPIKRHCVRLLAAFKSQRNFFEKFFIFLDIGQHQMYNKNILII